MIRVLFLINSLGGGGAERVLVNLVNNMDLDKFQIEIQTIFRAEGNKRYLNPRILVNESNSISFHGISRLYKLIPSRLLYKHFVKKGYDIVISYLEGITMKILSGAPKDIKTVVWLHSQELFLTDVFWKREIKKVFSHFNRIVGVSNQVCSSFTERYGIDTNVMTIYNTNDVESIRCLAQDKIQDNPWDNCGSAIKIVTLGRLDPVKGYDRLLSVCARLKGDDVAFKLVIVGDGEEMKRLVDIRRTLGLERMVFFTGFKINPYPYVRAADLYICSSLLEGLNTAMSEAIILNKPVISTKVSGATEVLGENNEYGLVVENNEEALYNGMKKMMTNPKLLEHYRQKSCERAAFFDPINTVKAVENMIVEVVECRI